MSYIRIRRGKGGDIAPIKEGDEGGDNTRKRDMVNGTAKQQRVFKILFRSYMSAKKRNQEILQQLGRTDKTPCLCFTGCYFDTVY